MCPIRQLMSWMGAQLSHGKDKQSQSAKSWSSDWPFPALYKTTTVPSAAIEYQSAESFCSHITFQTHLILFDKKQPSFSSASKLKRIGSFTWTSGIDLLVLPLISIFCCSGTSWRKIDCQANKQLCCFRSVSQTAVKKPKHTNLRINTLCLWNPLWSGQTDLPVEQPSVASEVWNSAQRH